LQLTLGVSLFINGAQYKCHSEHTMWGREIQRCTYMLHTSLDLAHALTICTGEATYKRLGPKYRKYGRRYRLGSDGPPIGTYRWRFKSSPSLHRCTGYLSICDFYGCTRFRLRLRQIQNPVIFPKAGYVRPNFNQSINTRIFIAQDKQLCSAFS